MKAKQKVYKTISILLGFLGTVNATSIGLYLLLTGIALSPLLKSDQLFQIYLGSILAFICVPLLLLGTYLIWKEKKRTGGIINLGTGAILVITYVYLTLFSEPRILEWLGFSGLFLFVPQILGGSIAIYED